MSDVFLSYANEDRDRIAPLVSVLEDGGWSVFWDRTVPAGTSWRTAIGDELASAGCVLVVWSRTSIRSTWVSEEAERGRERGVLIPVRIDPVAPPLGFGAIQTRDLSDWNPRGPAPPELERLLNDVALRLGSSSVSRRTPGPAPSSTDTPRDPLGIRAHRNALAAGGLALLVVLTILVFSGLVPELGPGPERDPIALLEGAVDDGDAAAMVELGKRYAAGRGVAQDYSEALRLYHLAADEDYPLGIALVGKMYDYGRGVPQDFQEAARWYRKAADAGSALGMVQLGALYHEGAGVEKDFAEALRWYRRSAEAGNIVAMSFVADAYARGDGVAADPAEATLWYRRAAEGGELRSMYNLAARYEGGRDIEKDYCKAIYWYGKAARLGYKPAAEVLEELGEPVPSSSPGVADTSDITGTWLTPESLLFRFQVKGDRVFGNIQESYGDRPIIGGPGYFDRGLVDGRIQDGSVTFTTIERFESPVYSEAADGTRTTTYVDREVRTVYEGTISSDEIDFVLQRDDGSPHRSLRVRRRCSPQTGES